MEQFETIKSLAKIWNVHPDTVRGLIDNYRLEATKIGKVWRISQEAINKYLAANTIKAVR